VKLLHYRVRVHRVLRMENRKRDRSSLTVLLICLRSQAFECFRHRRRQGVMFPTKISANIVILCFESRYRKQNGAIRLKSNILAPQTLLGWLCHWLQAMRLLRCANAQYHQIILRSESHCCALATFKISYRVHISLCT